MLSITSAALSAIAMQMASITHLTHRNDRPLNQPNAQVRESSTIFRPSLLKKVLDGGLRIDQALKSAIATMSNDEGAAHAVSPKSWKNSTAWSFLQARYPTSTSNSRLNWKTGATVCITNRLPLARCQLLQVPYRRDGPRLRHTDCLTESGAGMANA
jgi:hypothetical protein